MNDLTRMLDDAEIEALRAVYDPNQLRAANARAFSETYPPLAPWAQTVAAVFYRNGPLSPRDRELCLVTLLTHRAPGLALGNHVYWALMEGVSVAEICEAIGLAGCYGGLPNFGNGMLVLQKALEVLRRVAAQPDRDSRAVLAALVHAFAGVEL